MKKLLFPLYVAVCLAVVGVSVWYFNPGSPYSPRKVIEMATTDDRAGPYRMMERIYPSSAIKPSTTPTTFPRAERTIPIAYTYEGAKRTFEEYVADRRVQGILVLQDGQVVMEEYFEDAGPQDQFTSWSVAKSFVSSLIGIALMEGKIESLDDKAGRYAIEYAGTDYGETSIRHLLMMSSGIDFEEAYEVPGSDIRKLFNGTFLWKRDVDTFLRTYKRDQEPGKVFNYISSDTQVLSAFLRGAYGQPLIETFNEKLAEPLGITGGSWLTDRPGPAGKELGYCCLQLTLEDYAKLGQLYIQDGVMGEKRILPEGWMNFVRTPPQPSHEPAADGARGYTHHFWVFGGDDGAFSMQGYDGQFVHMDPQEGVVIVMTSVDRSPFDETPEFGKLFRAIKDGLKEGEPGISLRASQP